MRVAANALEMMRRQLELAPAAEAAEQARACRALLGEDGDLEPSSTPSFARPASRPETMDLETPGLADHLWATTLAKLAVDQPTYAAYRASLADLEKAERRRQEGLEKETAMDFALPQDLVDYLAELDAFIEAQDQAAGEPGRQYPLLRPPPRERQNRLG